MHSRYRLKWKLFPGLFVLGVLTSQFAVQADEVFTSPLHLESYYGPYLDLTQTTAGGHPAQTWDILGPVPITTSFSLIPGHITLKNNGLGFNISPQVLFHVNKMSGITGEVVTQFQVNDDFVGRLNIDNVNGTPGVFVPRIQGKSISANAGLILEGQIDVDTGTGPVIVHNSAKISGGGLTTRPLVVYRNNGVAKVTVSATGVMTATAFQPVSSRALKSDLVELDSRTAQRALKQLAPVRYVYQDDPDNTAHVGFIAEDVPELVADSERKSVPIMDVVALLTRVVKDNQAVIETQQKSIDEGRKEIDLHFDAINQKAAAVKNRESALADGQKRGDAQQKLIDDLTRRLESMERQRESRSNQ